MLRTLMVILGGLWLMLSSVVVANEWVIQSPMVTTVSGNALLFTDSVIITWDDYEIRARELIIDLNQQRGEAHQDLAIRLPSGTITPSRILFELEKREAHFDDVSFEVSPPDLQANFFVKAARVTTKESYFNANHASLTTCSLPNPHYHIWSYWSQYQPNHRILSIGNILWAPLPLGIGHLPILIPAYYYAIGERQVIWNIPTIGRRDYTGWGWFVQNTIDYNLTQQKSSSVMLDWFENQGIGLGITHIQPIGDVLTSWSFYELQQAPTNQTTKKSAISAWLTGSPIRVTANVESVDGEKFNTPGREVRNSRSLDMGISNDAEEWGIRIKNNDDIRQKRQELSIDTTYQFNGQSLFSVSHQQTQFLGNQTSFAKSQLDASIPFLTNSTFFINTLLDRNVFAGKADDLLMIQSSVQSTWNANIITRLSTAMYWDLDLQTVTRDNSSGRNNYLIALPQLDIFYQQMIPISYPLGPFSIDTGSISSKLTIGRFQESQYDASSKFQRIYPLPEAMDAYPNAFILDSQYQQVVRWGGKWFPTQFRSIVSYKQQVFRSPGRSWLDSDSGYLLGYKGSMEFQGTGWMSSSIIYDINHAPSQNNSPFYYFDLRSQQRHQVGGEVAFYLISPTFLRWENATQYNFITSRWNPYSTELSTAPLPYLSASIRTGRELSVAPEQRGTEYLPTDFRFNWGGVTDNIRLGYHVIFNTNDWVYQDRLKVIQSGLSMSLNLWSNTDYATTVGLAFQYNTQNPEWQWSAYELQSLFISFKEHCRTLTFNYNKVIQEWSIQFNLDAFPNDKIGYVQQRSGWRFKGLLDEKNQERL